MANWEYCPVVERTPGKAGGRWLFKDTEVPLYRLYECLASDWTVDDFAERFSVDVEQAAAALRYEADELHDYRLDYPDGVPWMRTDACQINGPKNAVWETCPEIEQAPGRLAGAWVFKHTRLPLYCLYDNLTSGATIGEFVEWYDGAGQKQVAAVLTHVARELREARPAYADTV